MGWNNFWWIIIIYTYIFTLFKVAELVFFSHEEFFGGNVETATIIQYHNVLWGQIKSDWVLYFCIKLTFPYQDLFHSFLCCLEELFLYVSTHWNFMQAYENTNNLSEMISTHYSDLSNAKEIILSWLNNNLCCSFLPSSLYDMQARRKLWKTRGARSTVVGIICPLLLYCLVESCSIIIWFW